MYGFPFHLASALSQERPSGASIGGPPGPPPGLGGLAGLLKGLPGLPAGPPSSCIDNELNSHCSGQ
jgi:hypothetical protein